MNNEQYYSYRKELETLGYSTSVVNNYPKYARELMQYSREIVKNITEEHIKNYKIYLQNKIGTRTKKPLSDSHIHSILLAIKMYFEYLERTEKITKNPFTLKLKSPIKKERNILTQEEIQELYNACETLQEKIILHLCYGCGLRRMEVEALNTKDIHFETKLLYVRKGKGKKRRVVPITDSIAHDCKKYHVQSKMYRKNNEESFLLNKQGTRITGQAIYETFKKTLKRTNATHFSSFTLHSLRHSIATHLLENGVSLEMVRDFLGHNLLKTTQIYTRISQEQMRSIHEHL